MTGGLGETKGVVREKGGSLQAEGLKGALPEITLGQKTSLEKEMATHSSILAWRIPGMGEPDGLPSMGLHRVGHN